MTAQTDTAEQPRTPLSRERVLAAAIDLADDGGVEALSMRRLAQELGVVPMALYKHVANKDELLDGMIDTVIGEIELPPAGTDWKPAIRQRVLSARRALLRHPWASRVIEARRAATPAIMAYMNETIGIFRSGGFSIDLTHHAMHAMGSRLLGFSQELFDDSPIVDPEMLPVALQALEPYPHIGELVTKITHDEASIVGSGCDDQFEFEFALDLMLEGLQRVHEASARSTAPRR
jgi:AcrR family transcriptional regulator